SIFSPGSAVGGRSRKRLLWLRHAPSQREPTVPSTVRRRRASSCQTPVRAAWPWLGQPRPSVSFLCATGLPAHANAHRLPPGGDEAPLRFGSASRLGRHPISSAIVDRAGGLWIGIVLPSAGLLVADGFPWRGSATQSGLSILGQPLRAAAFL